MPCFQAHSSVAGSSVPSTVVQIPYAILQTSSVVCLFHWSNIPQHSFPGNKRKMRDQIQTRMGWLESQSYWRLGCKRNAQAGINNEESRRKILYDFQEPHPAPAPGSKFVLGQLLSDLKERTSWVMNTVSTGFNADVHNVSRRRVL